METIILKATIGDQIKEVHLVPPSGAMGVYFIMIDNYFYGQVVPDKDEGWRVELQNEGNPDWMTEDDKRVIIEAVRKNETS